MAETFGFSNASSISPFHFEPDASTGVISLLLRSWRWYWLLLALIAWEGSRVHRLTSIRPRSIRITGPPTFLGFWFTGIYHALFAKAVINNAYAKSRGKPWAIPTRDKFNICLPTKQLIEEFNSASVHDISLQGAVHELFPPYELYGGMPAGDVTGNLGLSQAVFKSTLRSHLPTLQPVLRKRMEESFSAELRGKQLPGGWTETYLYRMTYRMAARLNSCVIVGEELSSDPVFSTALFKYLENATIAEELMRLVPSFLKTLTGSIVMRRDKSMRVMLELITKQMQNRLSNSQSGPEIPLISFAFYRMCRHPEYVAPLRQEAESFAGSIHNTHNEDMPLLDSFLKEVARMHPITIVSMPHKVQTPFTFSDGTHVPPANWVSIPQQAIMEDPNLYPEPSTFQGFRFLSHKTDTTSSSESRFSHPSWMFPYWGTIRQACPARFYVSMISKMIVAHLLLNYDFKLADESAKPTFTWGIASVPHPRLRILTRPRTQEG